MPELPEVETIARSLRMKILGQKIKSVRLLFPGILRRGRPSALETLKGQRFVGVRRRGKMILLDLENRRTLLFHLKMTGQLLFCPSRSPLDKHTHLVISFQGKGQDLRFRDVRKFGFFRCLQTPKILRSKELRHLGLEPLNLDRERFQGLLLNRKCGLKSALLNQKTIAGIGNIYADEILFDARLHPLTSISALRQRDFFRLFESLQKVLKEAIELRGSSVRNYLDTNGQEGSFQEHHQVYGRESLACNRCGRPIVRIKAAGRSTHYCPACQRKRSSKVRFPKIDEGKFSSSERAGCGKMGSG